ncbi:MAG TPA: tripartite tricarboxylate transporter substrate binding protein [Pseudolabrys sp.]|nr:tripartite tricarboxylate transporter substrate binding protein [Pseudolabrys sp.]
MRLALRALLSLALLVPAAGASAQSNWPDRPIKLLVTSAAGGGIDLMARILADALSRQLPQRVIVENNGGAGGLIATRTIAKSDPDGYSFLFQGPGHAYLPYIRKNPGYDVRKDFASVSLVATYPLVLVTRPSLKVSNLADFIALAKKQPGKLTYGSSGVGGASHIPLAAFADQAGIEMVHVPFRGSGQTTTALLADQIDLVIDGLAPQIGNIQEKRVIPLGVSTRERSPFMKDLPAISETLSGFYFPMWVAIFAPGETPKPIVDKMAQAIATAMKDPATKKRFEELVVNAVGSTPAELDTFLDEQLTVSKRVIEKTNIQIAD